MAVRKLVCDRCGKEIIDDDDIELALEGAQAWQAAVRARGDEPRGLFPCENYMRCHGEMQLVEDKKSSRLGRGLKRFFIGRPVRHNGDREEK